jgi:hypothetical protein
MTALEMGAVETLIMWENLDVNRYELMNTATGETVVKYLTMTRRQIRGTSLMKQHLENLMSLTTCCCWSGFLRTTISMVARWSLSLTSHRKDLSSVEALVVLVGSSVTRQMLLCTRMATCLFFCCETGWRHV